MIQSKYATGQLWTYSTRPGEDSSRLRIVRVDQEDGADPIYHLYIDGLSVRNPRTATGIQSALPHVPVSAQTLDSSVLNLVEINEGPMPDISTGYAQWRDAYDSGKAGVFSIPVSDIITIIEDTVNQAQ